MVSRWAEAVNRVSHFLCECVSGTMWVSPLASRMHYRGRERICARFAPVCVGGINNGVVAC